jgi:hypothetical protein
MTTGWTPTLAGGALYDVSKTQLIPLWHAVYHDFGLLESGISFYNRTAPSGAVGFGDYRDYYVRGFALALVLGELPLTWFADEKMSLVNEPSEQEMVAYLRRIVQARMTYANPYLVYGRMLRPLALDVPSFRIAGATGLPYTGENCPPFDEKTVLGTAWKSPRGKTAYVFSNISHDPQSFRLTISPADAEFPPSVVCSIFENRNGAVTNRAGLVGLPWELLVQINPLDVMLVEVVPHAPSLRLTSVVTNGAVVPNLAAIGGPFGATWILERTTSLPNGAWGELSRLAGTTTSFIDREATNYTTVYYRLKLAQ